MTPLDYSVIGIFFLLIIYFGYLFKQVSGNTRGFFLAGRSLPGWLAGISFISGNVSAMEILGLTGGAYVYGMVFAQYDWIGAIPAIVALSLIFVPFYYKSRIYNLPEFLGQRYGEATRTAHSFLMLSYMLLALGTGLYVFALALNVMLDWPIWISAIAAAIVLGVITASGGLPASVLVQFVAFSFIWFTLLPIPFLALAEVGWWSGLERSLPAEMLTVWRPASDPMMPWPATVLGLGIALAGASWSTDQAIMQNILAARSLEDARKAPLIGGIVKLAVPLITVIPGMCAAVLLPTLERPDTSIFHLILRYYPAGLAGLGFLSIMGAFSAMNVGMITGISNIFTRNIYRRHVKRSAGEQHYLLVSRVAALGALVLGVATALIAAQFRTVYVWMQEYNIFVIVPVFGVLLLGLFWRRATATGAFTGLVVGVVGSVAAFFLMNGQHLLWRAAATLALVLIVSTVFTLVSARPARDEMKTGVWETIAGEKSLLPLWQRAEFLAVMLLAVMTLLVIVFA